MCSHSDIALEPCCNRDRMHRRLTASIDVSASCAIAFLVLAGSASEPAPTHATAQQLASHRQPASTSSQQRVLAPHLPISDRQNGTRRSRLASPSVQQCRMRFCEVSARAADGCSAHRRRCFSQRYLFAAEQRCCGAMDRQFPVQRGGSASRQGRANAAACSHCRQIRSR